MRQWLIGQRVEFKYYMWGGRYWYVDDQCHRDDGGPAIEDTKDGYCVWWRHGEFGGSREGLR